MSHKMAIMNNAIDAKRNVIGFFKKNIKFKNYWFEC